MTIRVAKNIVVPMITPKSRLKMDETKVLPIPGSPKMFSMMIEPVTRKAKVGPASVRIGTSALRRPCWT